MTILRASELLKVWELGANASSTGRALLMLSAVRRGSSRASLANVSIGARDALLLDLYEALFGAQIPAQARCQGCAQTFELNVDTRSIRLSFDTEGRVHALNVGDYTLRFRCATSADLLLLKHGLSSAQAEALLLERCVLGAELLGTQVAIGALPRAVTDAVQAGIAELDAQAEIVFDVACAACQRVHKLPFDIAEHLWMQLERWARGLLREIHALARGYGWSEHAILAMSATRRRAYLGQLAAAGWE